jgi:hypothetical protein
MVGWARSAVHRPGAIPGWVQVYTLCKVDSFVLMFWDFYLPLIGESVVCCSRLEERGSIYLVDLDAMIEVRGEEVLALTLERSRLWRRGPG